MPRTLYQSILGDDFEQVPLKIREMHSFARVARGAADVTCGQSIIAGLICRLARLPEARKDVAVETTFAPIDGGERWTRRFDGQPFQTDMIAGTQEKYPCMVERLGPFTFKMRVTASPEGIDLAPEKVFLGPIPLWLTLAPIAIGRERVREGRYRFSVEVTFPLIGKVFGYDGWLEPAERVAES